MRGGREAGRDQDVNKENKKINEEKGIKELKSKLIPLLVYEGLSQSFYVLTHVIINAPFM